MKNIYAAILTPRASGTWGVSIPDLPGCVTSGETLDDALSMAADAANLWLISAEDASEPLPVPGDPAALSLAPGQLSTLVQVDTTAYRRRMNTRAVRKNVSLPAWMADLADKRGINCSQVLQDALRSILE